MTSKMSQLSNGPLLFVLSGAGAAEMAWLDSIASQITGLQFVGARPEQLHGHLVGEPHSLEHLAEVINAGLGHSALHDMRDGRWAVIAPYWSSSIDDWVERTDGCCCIVLFQTPSAWLTTWLKSGVSLDPIAALSEWSDQARTLVHAFSRRRGRYLLVSLAEARQDPDGFRALIGRRFNFEVSGEVSPAPLDEAPPLLASMAALLASQHPSSQETYAELFACSTALGSSVPAPSNDALAAVGSAVMQAREWSVEAPNAAQQRVRCQALSTELEATRSALAYAELATRDIQEEKSRLLIELATARCDAEEALNGSELMRAQLHDLFEELERRVNGSSVSQQLATSGCHGPTLQIGAVKLGPERDTEPHREYALTFFEVRHGDRNFKKVETRIVEHHGKPGIVLFADPGADTPLHNWQPNGEEAGKKFLLLIPSELQTSRLLAHLGTSDWLFVNALVNSAQAGLMERADLVAQRWRVMANRVREEFGSIGPRFRYDALRVRTCSSEKTQLSAVFVSALFGNKSLGDIEILWTAQPGAPVIEFSGPAQEDQRPFLKSWPVGPENGLWLQRWKIPLTETESVEARILPSDLQLILAILDALPAVAMRASELPEIPSTQASNLLTLSKEPFKKMRNAIEGSLLRRLHRAARSRFRINSVHLEN